MAIFIRGIGRTTCGQGMAHIGTRETTLSIKAAGRKTGSMEMGRQSSPMGKR
jgi:hypothetical protein